MKGRWSIALVAGCCLALFALLGNQPALDNRAADEAAVRAVNQEWFKAYAAGNIDALVALYADDAVVSNPGVPSSRGHDAIRKTMERDMADSRTHGTNLNPNPATEVGVTADMAWEWGTFTVTDKSGATVDNGKYLSVFVRRDGGWVILRDMWNSDAPMQAGK